MQNDFINNEEDFIRFFNATFEISNNNNNNNKNNNYEKQIENILNTQLNQIKFIKIFIIYSNNRKQFNEYQYMQQCHICTAESNHCIKYCMCNDVKYCINCFKNYVKNEISIDPAKFNNFINNYQNGNRPVILHEFIKCTACKNNNILIEIENMISDNNNNDNNNNQNNFAIANYLHEIDFFSNTADENGQWYCLYNSDGVIRYILVKDPNYLKKNKTEKDLRIAGNIWIFQIIRPRAVEHARIIKILSEATPNNNNMSNEHIKNYLVALNQTAQIPLELL